MKQQELRVVAARRNLDSELISINNELAELELTNKSRCVIRCEEIIDLYIGTEMSEDSLVFLIECAMFVNQHSYKLKNEVVDHINMLCVNAIGKVKISAHAFMAQYHMNNMIRYATSNGIEMYMKKYLKK